MRSLAGEVIKYYPRQLAARTQILNEWAALYGGLLESNVGGQPYIGYNALVLSQPEKDKLSAITEIFGNIMNKALQAIVDSGPSTFRKLGWPEILDFALRYEPPNRYLTAVGRFDFILDPAGEWHLLEFNSDTPSGSQEVSLIEERLYNLMSGFSSVTRLNPTVGEDMAQAFYQEALFAPVPYNSSIEIGPDLLPRVGFITQARHLTDLAQVEFYASKLRQLGLDCIVGDILNITLAGDELLIAGKAVDAVWRLYPIENFSRAPIFAAYVQANLVGTLKCLNNLRGFLAQSKAVLAWIWQNREDSGLFDKSERVAISCYLPETYLLSDLPVDFDYRLFVIKEFYGREGAEVYNGAELSVQQWKQCREWETFVVQKRVDIAPVLHPVFRKQNLAFLAEAFPCVGSFLIANRWGGCYSRVGARITNSQAQFVPTFLDQM